MSTPQWITDRAPQAADLDIKGMIQIPAQPSNLAISRGHGVELDCWHPGVPWRHTKRRRAAQSNQLQQTGLRCKCRPDWYSGSTIVDLKTTTDASPAGFARSVAAYRYHVQAQHYLSGLQLATTITETCGTCRFYRNGECRRHAPAKDWGGSWPQPMSNDWCGEWEAHK